MGARSVFHIVMEPYKVEYFRSRTSYTIAGGSQGRTQATRENFPVPKQNGHLVSGETIPPSGPHLTYYHSEGGSRVRAENPPRQNKRRLQSLQIRKPKAAEDESPRMSNSAPTKKGQKAVAPLPKMNNLMAKLRTSEREQTYGRHWTNDHAGVTTKAHEAQNNRSHKFATSWANARAEQANIRRGDRESPDEKQTKTEKKSEPPKSETHKKQTTGTSDISTKEREQINRRNEQTLHHVFHASDNKETSSPRDRNDNNRKVNGSPFLDLRSREKKPVKDRSDWNPSYVVEKPPFVSRRRQQEELTHHPVVTDTNEVYKAYTGVTKRELRNCDDNVSRIFSQYGDVYHATLTVSPRNKKEYVLTLREADTYKKINSVYGADGVRKKRKSLLLEKLMTVELEQIKQHNQKLRDKERKKYESKRRQQKQLYTIRKRFKQQQTRRFRSQYVTSRVLEHEKMNRKEYGLPEEEEEQEKESDKDDEVQEEASQESTGKKKEEPISSFDKKKKRKAYEKKYKNMFDISVGPAWDPRGITPKMEGVDVVTVEVKDKEGNVKEKKAEVKDIVKEARKVLNASSKDLDISDDESRGATPTSRSTRSRRRRKPSLDSLELESEDDDDIFERARRKYHLDVDSSH